MATLGGRLAALDADRLVGRRTELAFLERVLDGQGEASVVFLHGVAGIGKSTLLRAAARTAAARGYTTLTIDGRAVAASPAALTEAFAPAFEEDQPLLLIDAFERLDDQAELLRDELMPLLSERAVVLVAGRRPPGSVWFRDGWEAVCADLELHGLSRTEAHALLALRGHVDGGDMRRIVAEAHGLPLALVAHPPRGVPGAGDPTNALVRQIAESEIEGGHADALAVAAVARHVTEELLAAVLGDAREARDGYRWLATRTFVQRVGGALALHDVLRRALARDLREREPERDRDLRRRIADHVHARGLSGEPLQVIDLVHLVENPAVRWALSWDGATEYRADNLGEGDVELIGQALRRGRGEGWAELMTSLMVRAPELTAVVRTTTGRPAGYVLSTTPGATPPAALDDPALAALVEHARSRAGRGSAVIMHDADDFTAGPEGDPLSAVRGIVHMTAILRSGLANPRHLYARVDTRVGPIVREAVGAFATERLPQFDIEAGETHKQCVLIDFGPGGLLGALHAIVYAELGLAAPGPDQAPRPVPISGDDVREALRSFQVPAALAASPLARGSGSDQRAESVRDLLRSGVDRAFGDSDRERGLREVLVRGYLDSGPSHEQVADQLHLSRATYFRRLRSATERLVELLTADAG
jgi:hypothetical protein